MKKPTHEEVEAARTVLKAHGIIDAFWHQDDIKGRANERGIKLTSNQIKEIAEYIARKHDASQGINWDTIDCFTDMYLEDN